MKLKLFIHILILVFIFAKESVASENVIIKSDIKSEFVDITKEQKKLDVKSKQDDVGEKINLYGSEKYNSLFFTNKELENLISIIRGKGLKTDSFQDSFSLVDVGSGQERISTVIFLNSILFLSKNNWTIWVNDKKISSHDETTTDLQVISITNSKVKFFWKVGRTKWEIMMPNFKFEDSISKLTKNNEVETIFTLQPNQTFIPQTGEIIEGKKDHAPPKINAEQGVEGEEEQSGNTQNNVTP